MYCSVPIRRLLAAGSGAAESTSKVRRYPCGQGLLDIPPGLAGTYPIFAIAEEEALALSRLERARECEAAARRAASGDVRS
jgi:hypothetical protein